MTFQEFLTRFNTEAKIIAYFIKIRYGDELRCNHCGSTKVYQRHTNHKVCDCESCHNTFSVFKNTIFEHSSTDLRKWFYAIHLFLNGKKGISAMQLQREIGVTYKTAWRILHQIRKAMSNKEAEAFFNAIVEVDETYVGGKPRKGNKDDLPRKRGRGTPVVGVISRDDKRVEAGVAKPDRAGKKLSGKQLMAIIDRVVKDASVIMTDEFSGYNILKYSEHIHKIVDHSKEFSRGDIHVNNLEAFWSILKRGILGIYHHVSVKYLQGYINEFCFRYNHRENEHMFDTLIKQSVLV